MTSIPRPQLVLVLGDLMVFAAFVLVGASSHDDGITLASFGRSFLPFAAVWFLLGPLLGAFRLPAANAWPRLLVIWLICGLLALALRSLALQRPFWSAFTLIALVFNGSLLLGWRGVLSWLAGAKLSRGVR
ncbi:MAG TPA: DUF3054 domain-containing protein, partial [Dehalococcoidia bacterium]|nr:DUF3054 domain-containing protein [Dehalococcoidia bacterium]